MKKDLIILVVLLLVLGGPFLLTPKEDIFGATIITTDSTDTIGTFRTNVNTSLTNLNDALAGVATFSYLFPGDATSTRLSFTGGILVNNSTSTITNLLTTEATSTNATTTNLNISNQLDVDGLTSALVLTGAGGVFAEYAGASSCTNQFFTGLSALGASTCASINNDSWSGTDLSVLNGGTGLSSFTANSLLYSNSDGTALAFTATSTISLGSVLATITNASTTALTVSTFFQLPNSTSQSPTLAGVCGYDTTSGQLKCGDGTNTDVVGNGNTYPAFTYATSTAWTGTTTVPIGTAYIGETWNGAQCFTDIGTLFVQFTDNTNNMDDIQASTTVGTNTFTTNNTFTATEKRYVKVGTPASAPQKISCTVSKSLIAD